MGTCPRQADPGPVLGEIEVSDATLGAYARLLAIVGQRLRTHRSRDGALICEDRRVYTRPMLWRITPDGMILPDSRYSFTLRGFTPVALPQGA